MKVSILFLAVFFSSLHSFSQIESGKSTGKKKKTKEVNKTSPTSPAEEFTLLSINYGHGNSYRTLKENKGFYGDSIGERSKETVLATNAFYLGANSKLSKNIYLDFGIGFQQYGEQYKRDFTDSVISYTSKYNNVVLPFKFHIQTGKKVIFFFNTGNQAQLLANYTNEYSVAKNNNETSTTTHSLKFKNSFSLASTSSLGMQYPFSPKSCLLISIDYIQQLSSTLNKEAPHIHKSNFYGFKIGLGFKI